jgi:hypothetical protein
MSGTRHLASLLLRHARWMLPESRAAWADAMERETQHIQDDREVLSWAFGCVLAAYADRFRLEDFLLPWTARLLLAGWCLQFPFFHVTRLYRDMTLAGSAPGLEGYEPLALQILGSIAACLYLLAGLRLACNRKSALMPYGVACVISFATFGHMGLFLQYSGGVFILNLLSGAQLTLGTLSLSLDALQARFLFGVTLPVLLGLAIGVVDRHGEDAPTARRLV